MGNPGDLAIECGEDYVATMTYRRDGAPLRVGSPVGEIRQGEDSSSELVLRMDSTAESAIITQAEDGVLSFRIPHTVTSALPPGNWYWDLFGVINGDRKKLVKDARVEISRSITSDS